MKNIFIKKEIKNKGEYCGGILMAFKPIESAEKDMETAEKWLYSHEFVPWGHNKKKKENEGNLFVHEKGVKVSEKVFALLKYEDILTKNNFAEEMLPPKWREIDYTKWNYFYKVTRVIHKNIPFNMLENRNGKPLNPRGGMNELVPVQVKKVF